MIVMQHRCIFCFTLYMEVFLPSLLNVFSNLPFSLLWNSLSHTECRLGNSLALNFAESQWEAKKFRRNVSGGKQYPENEMKQRTERMRWEKTADRNVNTKVLKLRDREDDDVWSVLVLSGHGQDTFRPSLSRPGRARPGQAGPDQELTNQPKGDFYCSRFPSIRYTQGKQEGIRMGPDRHLVCWEISLGRSERLPSPLPAPAHQMWGEERRLPALCVRHGPGYVLHPHPLSPHAGRRTHSWFIPPAYLRVGMRLFFFFFFCQKAKSGCAKDSPHLCSSPPSPLLLSTILHRSEATSSFCWSVRLRLGRCSWQALLSERLNSR